MKFSHEMIEKNVGLLIVLAILTVSVGGLVEIVPAKGAVVRRFSAGDIHQILEVLMQQERLPVTLLEAQKTTVDKKKSAFASLASRLSTLK